MKKVNIEKIYCVFLLFIYIYIPPLFPCAMIVWGLMFLGLCMKNIGYFKRVINSKSIVVWGVFFCICFWSILVNAYFSGMWNSIRILTSQIYLLLWIIVGECAILIVVQKSRYSRKAVWELIIITGIAQAILSVLSYLFEPVQNILCFFLKNIMSLEDINWWRNYRLYGLSSSLNFAMPIVQALIGGFSFIYAEKCDSRYYWAVPLIWISAIVNARVAIVVILIEIAFWGFQKIVRQNRIIRKDLFCLLFGFCCMSVCAIFLIKIGRLDISRIIDPFYEIISVFKGDFVPKTNGYISYFYSDSGALNFPKGRQLFLGGEVINNTSDVGYIMHLWLGGLFFCTFLYCFYLILLKMWSKTFGFDKEMKMVVWIYGVTLFVVNIKGDAFIFINDFINLFYLAIGLSFLYDGKSICYDNR